jgi:succinate dehydrogenase/fumarate reductase-like Fe-S protein
MRWKNLYATFVLGLQLLIHVVRRLMGRASPGLKQFLDNYRDDGIPALSMEDRRLIHEISRCVTCRLCDSLCEALPHTNPADFLGPAFYPSSASRLIPDYPYAVLDEQACASCAGCDVICPRGVPIEATFDLMRRKVREIRGD